MANQYRLQDDEELNPFRSDTISHMAKHALDPEDKQARRNAILAAARTLFMTDMRSLPSAARIAKAAELAKGTVYLYFQTKEEIFVALLNEEWSGLLRLVHASFTVKDRNTDEQIADFMQCYVEYIVTHPELLRLDAMGYSVLERNLGHNQLRAFKLSFSNQLTAAGELVDSALELPQGRGVSLLMRTYALTRGLWQVLDYPEELEEMMSDPELTSMRPKFNDELAEALREYWYGALRVDTR